MQENFGRRYWLVSFGIYNYADVRELYGAQQMDRCLAQIGSWIRKTFPGVNSSRQSAAGCGARPLPDRAAGTTAG